MAEGCLLRGDDMLTVFPSGLSTRLEGLGDCVRSFRVAQKMTLKELAKKMNRPQVYVGEIERGKRSVTRKDYEVLNRLFPFLCLVDFDPIED